jgi:hypothetical protein
MRYKLRAELRWTSKRRRVGAQFTVRHRFGFFYVLLVGFWRSTAIELTRPLRVRITTLLLRLPRPRNSFIFCNQKQKSDRNQPNFEFATHRIFAERNLLSP